MNDPKIPENILKALEWSKDWSTWLVGIQTALLGGLFALKTTKDKKITPPVNFRSQPLLSIAVWFFVLSIACATFTLGGIPYIAQNLTPTTTDVLKTTWPTWGGFSVQLEVMNVIQQSLFIAGVICLAFNIRFKD